MKNDKKIITKMKILVKKLFLLVCLTGFLSCESYKVWEDYNFDEIMFEYFNTNLSYPKTGEEFCQRWFIKDSVDHFEWRLKGTAEYVWYDLNLDELKHLSYQHYNEILDTLYTIDYERHRKALENETDSPLWKYLSTRMTWQYIYRNKDWIRFEQEDTLVAMYNTKKKEKYLTSNYLHLDKKYLKDPANIPYDSSTNLRRLNALKVFTKDSISIAPDTTFENTNFPKENEEIRSIIEQMNASKESSGNRESLTRKNYVLHYNRRGEMRDFVNDAPAPASFCKNDTLINFLERWMDRDARIDFIHFSAYELE